MVLVLLQLAGMPVQVLPDRLGVKGKGARRGAERGRLLLKASRWSCDPIQLLGCEVLTGYFQNTAVTLLLNFFALVTVMLARSLAYLMLDPIAHLTVSLPS